MAFVSVKKYVHHLYLRTRENEVSALGAQLSYYFILSVFPFLIFVLTLLDYTPLTQQHTLQQLSLVLPDSIFLVLNQIIDEISRAHNATLISLGFLGTVWTASRGTFALIRSINKAYETRESRSFLVLNVVAVLTTFALALVILFTLFLLVFGKLIGLMLFARLGLEELFLPAWSFLRYLIPITVIFIVFSLLYLYAPNYPLRFRNVYPGAVFATLGWIVASELFAHYVNNFGHFSITYGSLGGIIVLLVWLYISSMIILLGGEINAALKHISGEP